MCEAKQATTHRTNFYGLHLPKGAVYVVMPECVIKGRKMPKLYAWVDDLDMAYRQQHFYVNTLTVNDRRPRKVYVDGKHGYARVLKDFIMALPEARRVVTPTILLREMNVLDKPKDREVGRYTMRARMGYFTNPYVTTEYDCLEMKVYKPDIMGGKI